MLSNLFGRPDLSLTAEEIELRRRLQKRVLVFAGCVLLLVASALFFARPAVHAIHGWQARRHAAKAFVLIDKQDWSKARDEATAAYRLRSTEPQAIRAIARLFSNAGHPEAFKYWRDLGERTTLTNSDLREEAAVALKLRETTIANEAVAQLLDPKRGQSLPGDWLLAAQVEIQKQNSDKAIDYVSQILKSSAASEREQFQATLLWDQLLDAKQPADHHEPVERLAKMAKSPTQVGLDALVSLGQRIISRKATSDDGGLSIDEIVSGLEQHPLSKPPHKLLAIDLKTYAHPENRDALLQEGIEQFKQGDNVTLIALAAWLNGRGEYQKEIDTIPLERALQTNDLFFQHVDALGALGRWDEIRRLIEAEKFPLDPVVEHMYLARCYAQLGQENGADNNWQRALQAAAGEPAKLLSLGEYAEKNGALAIAEAAFDAALAVAPGSRQIQQNRLRIAYAQLDTAKVSHILSDFVKLWPNDPAVLNDEAYIRLLRLDEKSATPQALSTIADLAENLVRREPSSLPHRSLLALARLKQHRPEEALAVYNDIHIAPGALTSSALAVHIAVLTATGHQENANTERGRLELDRLLPEERALAELK